MVISDYITSVMYVDPSGESFIAVLGSLLVGAVLGGVIGAITAAIEGGDVFAGFASGAVSGVILTMGIAFAVVSGGFGGVAISAAFGFGAGFSGDLINQGMSEDWKNLDYSHATMFGGVTAVFSVITFGFTNFISRNSVGVFESIFNKSLTLGSRIASSLSISAASIIITGFISLPLTIANEVGNRMTNRYYGSRNSLDIDMYS